MVWSNCKDDNFGGARLANKGYANICEAFLHESFKDGRLGSAKRALGASHSDGFST